MLFYLTDMFLDVIWGTGYWVIKKTSKGVYYLIWGNGNINLENHKKEYETIILTKENIDYDDTLKELVEKTISQEKKIDELHNSIIELKSMIKKSTTTTNQMKQ